MSFCLIILAGGNSHRFRSNIGKAYQKIAGKSLIEININKARHFKQIKKIILVYNKKDSKRAKSLKLKNIKLIAGGKNRQQSTFNALKHLNNTKTISKVLIHDVARPNFSLKLFASIIRNMKNARAVVPKLDIQDAVKQKNSKLIDNELSKIVFTSEIAKQRNMRVNAGHDLDLINLPLLIDLNLIDEVSIGHAIFSKSLNKSKSLGGPT